MITTAIIAIIALNNNINLLIDTIKSYSLPTVDFSIIPTNRQLRLPKIWIC